MRFLPVLHPRGVARAIAWLVLGLLVPLGAALAHDDSPEVLREAARRGGWDATARAIVEAERLLDDGDAAGARRMLDAARAIGAADPRVAGLGARLALDEGRPREADSLASLALAGRPGDRGALLSRARARAALGDSPGALADFDRLIADASDHAEERVVERANIAWKLEGAAAALAALERQTPEGLWTPARRSLAASLERALGLPVRAREGLSEAATSGALSRPALPSQAQEVTDTLIARGSSWLWFAGPDAPAGEWMSAGYPDGGWSAGPAPLGYGETRIVTQLPYGGITTNRWVTAYLRAHFTRAAGASQVLSAVLKTDYDDGFVAYLNGVEIARRGLAPGPVSWGTFAVNHESGAYETIALADPGLLQAGDNVLAVEVHQQAPNSSDLLWDTELLASTLGVARTRGPYLQNATPTAISVRWRTASAVVGRVSLGPAGGPYELQFDEAGEGTEHEVRLTGLSPETAYAYSVHGTLEPEEPVSDARTFRTPPPAGAGRPVRIWAIGDSGMNNASARAVRDAFLAWSGPRHEDLWLLLGDNAYTAGTDAEYQAGLFDQYPLTLSRSPLWSTRGNHDLVYAGIDNDYYDLFTLPIAGEAGGQPSGTEAWYSFDWGPIHFVCLDSEGSDRSPGGPMLLWLRADLAATTQPWVIGFWHHPPYTKGSHDSDDPVDSGGRMRDMRENVLPILDSLGVDLVLSGHSHSYERSYLLDGHYGTSGTLVPSMKVDAGDGRPGGDGEYVKQARTPSAHEGVVYAVNGSACQVSGGTLNHPAMIASLNVLGSMVIDVEGERLEARFLNANGVVLDSFAIVKPGVLSVPRPGDAAVALEAARPSPFSDHTEFGFTLARAASARLAVYDVGGRRVRTLVRGALAAGTHRVSWDGRDDRGAAVAPGAYLVLLDAGGERRSRRVVRLP